MAERLRLTRAQRLDILNGGPGGKAVILADIPSLAPDEVRRRMGEVKAGAPVTAMAGGVGEMQDARSARLGVGRIVVVRDFPNVIQVDRLARTAAPVNEEEEVLAHAVTVSLSPGSKQEKRERDLIDRTILRFGQKAPEAPVLVSLQPGKISLLQREQEISKLVDHGAGGIVTRTDHRRDAERFVAAAARRDDIPVYFFVSGENLLIDSETAREAGAAGVVVGTFPIDTASGESFSNLIGAVGQVVRGRSPKDSLAEIRDNKA